MRILAHRLPELQAMVDKFNKKAAKWGLPLVEVSIIETKVEERSSITKDEDGSEHEHKFMIEVVYLEIKGETPRLAGWAIHSKIQPSEVAGQNFVFTAPNNEAIESLRYRPMFCEHCQTIRQRKTSYLVEHEDGRQVLVGSTCLKDFLPAINVETLVQYLDGFKAISLVDEDRPPRSEWVYHTDDALRDAIVSIRKYGFVSKAKAETSDTQPTSYDIDPPRERKKQLYQGTDSAQLEVDVQACKQHMLAKSDAGNDFIYNVRLALKQDYVKPKLFGYLAAAVNVWMRDVEAAREMSAGAMNEWFGTVGARVTIRELKLVGLSASDGHYGTTYIHRFNDKEGRLFVWFASTASGLKEGETYNVKATIKKHDEFKGRKQTIISRCSAV